MWWNLLRMVSLSSKRGPETSQNPNSCNFQIALSHFWTAKQHALNKNTICPYTAMKTDLSFWGRCERTWAFSSLLAKSHSFSFFRRRSKATLNCWALREEPGPASQWLTDVYRGQTLLLRLQVGRRTFTTSTAIPSSLHLHHEEHVVNTVLYSGKNNGLPCQQLLA